MVINPSVIGFGLARPDGQLVLVNSAQDREQLPNLLHQEVSRDSFLYTLQARHGVGENLFSQSHWLMGNSNPESAA